MVEEDYEAGILTWFSLLPEACVLFRTPSYLQAVIPVSLFCIRHYWYADDSKTCRNSRLSSWVSDPLIHHLPVHSLVDAPQVCQA